LAGATLSVPLLGLNTPMAKLQERDRKKGHM